MPALIIWRMRIGFTKSTNGGATWTIPIYAYQAQQILVSEVYLKIYKYNELHHFLSMAVDRSGGSRNGNIYITWPQRGVTPAGSDPDIVMIRSTDGGTTWSSPARVNNDARQ